MTAHAPYETHALITAAAAAQVSWSAAVARATGGEVWREGSVLCAHQPSSGDQVLILFPPRLEADTIDRILARCGELDAAVVGCWTSGLGDDERVGALLEPRGFVAGWQPHWMARELSGDWPGDRRVAEATEVPEYDGYGQALLEIARDPARRSWHFVAREDGARSGLAWLHIPTTAPHVGGLFDVFVDEPARRHGLGRALTSAACARAQAEGCTHTVANATGEGQLLYLALGFRSLGFGRTWWLNRRAQR